MDKKIEEEIKAIMATFQCPKDFQCYRSGFDNMCRAKDIGIKLFLDCLEQNPEACPFSLKMGGFYLCQCPLRVYIGKKVKK